MQVTDFVGQVTSGKSLCVRPLPIQFGLPGCCLLTVSEVWESVPCGRWERGHCSWLQQVEEAVKKLKTNPIYKQRLTISSWFPEAFNGSVLRCHVLL